MAHFGIEARRQAVVKTDKIITSQIVSSLSERAFFSSKI